MFRSSFSIYFLCNASMCLSACTSFVGNGPGLGPADSNTGTNNSKTTGNKPNSDNAGGSEAPIGSSDFELTVTAPLTADPKPAVVLKAPFTIRVNGQGSGKPLMRLYRLATLDSDVSTERLIPFKMVEGTCASGSCTWSIDNLNSNLGNSGSVMKPTHGAIQIFEGSSTDASKLKSYSWFTTFAPNDHINCNFQKNLDADNGCSAGEQCALAQSNTGQVGYCIKVAASSGAPCLSSITPDVISHRICGEFRKLADHLQHGTTSYPCSWLDGLGNVFSAPAYVGNDVVQAFQRQLLAYNNQVRIVPLGRHVANISDGALFSSAFPPDISTVQLVDPIKSVSKNCTDPSDWTTLVFGKPISDPFDVVQQIGGISKTMQFQYFERARFESVKSANPSQVDRALIGCEWILNMTGDDIPFVGC